MGLQANTSIKVINLSDNELSDQQAGVLCSFLKTNAEQKDKKLFELSLRLQKVEKHFQKMLKQKKRQVRESEHKAKLKRLE